MKSNKKNSKADIETKVQLLHPSGKKAVKMDKTKYNVFKCSILNFLDVHGAAAHKEMLKAVSTDLKKKKIKFGGSVEWHLEWVKLDLEARTLIRRTSDKSPVKFVSN